MSRWATQMVVSARSRRRRALGSLYFPHQDALIAHDIPIHFPRAELDESEARRKIPNTETLHACWSGIGGGPHPSAPACINDIELFGDYPDGKRGKASPSRRGR